MFGSRDVDSYLPQKRVAVAEWEERSSLQELSGTVRYCLILSGTVRYCQVMSDTVRYCQVPSGTV